MRTKMVFLPIEEFYGMSIELVRQWAAAVAEQVPDLEVAVVEPGADPARELADADAVFGILTPELLGHAKHIRWLQGPAASPLVGFYFPELIAHPLTVTNVKGTYRNNLANHVMALILAFARRLPWFLDQQDQGTWSKPPPDMQIMDLASTTALIVGAGNVGVATAERCRAFGIRAVGVDTQLSDVKPVFDELHPAEKLEDLLPDADWVVMTVPHTPQTEGMMNTHRFSLMKPSAYIMNVGRGGTIRLDDLVEALRKKDLAGAGLDVFEVEPLPADHALWYMPNVILTPHCSGQGEDTHREREKFIVENARRFVQGLPLLSVVDKANWF
jgi:phosphoglycerate dehydrogenase-like enzyme